MKQKIENTAKLAAAKAAEIQNHFFENLETVDYKGEIDLITKADLESQEAIVQTIAKAFPDHKILAEEDAEGHAQDIKGPMWVIDPLDGTSNYAHGLPIFAVSIGFVPHGEHMPSFGLIHLPVLNECFCAHKGQGAYKNGERISVSRQDKLDKSMLSTGFPYDRRTSKDTNLELFNHFEMNSLCVRRPGAAAVDLAYVACGRFDGFWELKLKPWDIAAGIVLVNEAGGQITDYRGNPLDDLRKNEIVASNARIHSAITDETQAYAL